MITIIGRETQTSIEGKTEKGNRKKEKTGAMGIRLDGLVAFMGSISIGRLRQVLQVRARHGNLNRGYQVSLVTCSK